jgi:hypothetical protein
MADEPSRSKLDGIRLWVSAVALPVVLGLAGYWQFYLKEVWWPATALNLTAEVSVREAGLKAAAAAEAGNLEAIELVITARNPSSNTIYLCANLWGAWGRTISAAAQDSAKSEDWLEGVTEVLNKRSPLVVGKHYNTDQATLISVGDIFTDVNLHANEKVSASFVFYVPQGLYDSIEVVVELPATSKENSARSGESALGVEYALSPDHSNFSHASIYRVASNGTHEPLARDAEGNLSQSDIKYYGWQSAVARVQLSLWQSRSPSSARTESPETSSPKHD